MFSNKTIAFHTLGCKLNFSETSSVARQMQAIGFQIVNTEKNADVYVINTCSVTDDADAKCRNMVRRFLKQNENAYIIVMGCYAQLKPQEIVAIKGVDLVIGAKDKFRLPELISDLTKNACGQVYTSSIADVNEFTASYSQSERTRAFLKIQDGCDYKCTFCTIPLARGKSRSDTTKNIIENIHRLSDNGVKEIVLTGVNTGDYGKGLQEPTNFYALIKELEQQTTIERYRISSIEPNLLTDEIIEFVAQSNKFMPHFHIPLQSGSNKLLALMQRRYQKNLYQSRVEQIKQLMPHACIGVDVIVGFPSENNDDFMETYNFIHELDISYLHVFTYSERQNTKAIAITDSIPMPIRQERCNVLRNLSDKKKHYFYTQHLQTSRTVLFEAEQKGTIMNGFTDNYIKISVPYQEQLINTIQKVRLEEINTDGTVAAFINTSTIASISQ